VPSFFKVSPSQNEGPRFPFGNGLFLGLTPSSPLPATLSNRLDRNCTSTISLVSAHFSSSTWAFLPLRWRSSVSLSEWRNAFLIYSPSRDVSPFSASPFPFVNKIGSGESDVALLFPRRFASCRFVRRSNARPRPYSSFQEFSFRAERQL